MTFNARRGGEPGKITLNDWKMAEEDRWKRESDLERLTDPVEKMLAKKNKLCYIEGKKKKREVRFRLNIFYVIYFSLGHFL